MNNKTRWAFTVVILTLVASSVVAEVSGGELSSALECLGKSPIAGLVAKGNALAIVP